jgi:hypothetical protein
MTMTQIVAPGSSLPAQTSTTETYVESVSSPASYAQCIMIESAEISPSWDIGRRSIT